jgi:hypothetical protein
LVGEQLDRPILQTAAHAWVLLRVPEDEILELRPMSTDVGGRGVYAAAEANGAF